MWSYLKSLLQKSWSRVKDLFRGGSSQNSGDSPNHLLGSRDVEAEPDTVENGRIADEPNNGAALHNSTAFLFDKQNNASLLPIDSKITNDSPLGIITRQDSGDVSPFDKNNLVSGSRAPVTQPSNPLVGPQKISTTVQNPKSLFELALRARDVDGQTLLHAHAAAGYLPNTTFLIERGANIREKDNEGKTPLHLAAQFGHPDVVALLLNNGADTKAQDQDGKTPLDLAKQFGHLYRVALSLNDGADIEVQNLAKRNNFEDAEKLINWKNFNNKLSDLRGTIVKHLLPDMERYSKYQVECCLEKIEDLIGGIDIVTKCGDAELTQKLYDAIDTLCDFWEVWQNSSRNWDDMDDQDEIMLDDMIERIDQLLSGQLEYPILKQDVTDATNQLPGELAPAIVKPAVEQAATGVTK